MKIYFYGVRGSIATPFTLKTYQNNIKKILSLYKSDPDKDVDTFFDRLPYDLAHIFGGNTSCLSIEEDKGISNEIIVIDAGSGLREFGNRFIGKGNLVFHIFFSHFHWDHICGIPFFKPIYNPTNTIIFYSPNELMLDNLSRQQHAVHFPMSFDKLPAKKRFVILDKQHEYKLNGFTIRTINLNHPGGSTGYIFQKKGKKISYASDAEFTPENVNDKKLYYKACFESSDVLIMDSQYSLNEFFNKFDWGHTSSTMAVNLALEWRIKKLVLFHFDPDHSDTELLTMLQEARELKSQFNKRKLDVLLAVEGQCISV